MFKNLFYTVSPRSRPFSFAAFPWQANPKSILLVVVAALWLPAVGGRGQSLMVGADGAVHLDELNDASVGEPVIVNSPEIIPPSTMGLPGPILTQPMSVSPEAYGMCTPQCVTCTPAVCVQPPPPPLCHGIWGEFLFLHPTGDDVVHAQQQNGTGGAGTVPFGALGVTDLHYEPGFRVGGDCALSPTSSLSAQYTFFESDAISRVDAPFIPGGGGSVGSLVQQPGAAIISSAGPVDAHETVKFQLADLDYRARLDGDQCYWLTGSVGLRYAHLDQEFSQLGNFSGSSSGAILTSSDIDFNGGGANFGLDGGRNIGHRGFAIYARANVAPIVGQFNARYNMTNTTTDVLLARVNWNDDRFMTLLDYEIGLSWLGPRRHWRLSAGYTAAFWFNALTTSEFIDSVRASDYVKNSSTVTFDGLTARVERLW